MKGNFAAIIPAAGLSSRIKQYKPLLPLGDENIADRVISIFTKNGIDVFLVVGYRRDEIKARIKNRDVTFVDNPDYEKGMFSSIQAGISHLPPNYQAFFIMPADIPLVRPATIKRITSAADKQPGNIIYPIFNGKRGHPPLIPSSLAPIITRWKGEGGLKAALESQEKSAREVPVADSNILFDVDTPKDYEELLERLQNYELPTDEECEAIYNICKVAPDRIRHCIKTAEVAVEIGKALNKAGHNLDLEVIRIAAKLHDIAKGQTEHDIAGGKILREMGFFKVGDIVAVHSELANDASLETKTVFLADKFVEGVKLVSLEARYSNTGRHYRKKPEIQAIIAKRLNTALSVNLELEKLLGYPLEDIIRSLNR